MQAEILSDEWFQQVNGLLGAAPVAEQPRQNSLNLLTGIECYYNSFFFIILFKSDLLFLN